MALTLEQLVRIEEQTCTGTEPSLYIMFPFLFFHLLFLLDFQLPQSPGLDKLSSTSAFRQVAHPPEQFTLDDTTRTSHDHIPQNGTFNAPIQPSQRLATV